MQTQKLFYHFKKIKIKKNELLIFILIFLLAFLIRSYKIEDFLFFGYEQGRDALVIEKLYKLEDFTLVGPKTDIGGIFHGPLYYYLMTIPYFIGSGSPLSASYFLIILGSFSVAIFYFFSREFFKSKLYVFLGTIFFIFSFEYILYARWLSNVSPTISFTLLAYFCLFKFVKFKENIYFIGFSFFAALASQFEIILIPQFLFSLLILLAFKLINLKKLKVLFYSLIPVILIFSPLIIFDLRNQNITLKTILSYFSGSLDQTSGNIFSNLNLYILQLSLHLKRTLINSDNVLLLFSFSIFITLGFIFFIKNEKQKGIFLISWFLMSLPLILIGPGNPHFYLGVGIAAILIFVSSLSGWIKNSHLKLIPIIFFITLCIVSFKISIEDVTKNKNIFFVTIQDDLNFRDQRKVLNHVHNDSRGEQYRFISFTIPSLQPEGWDYLHKYYYPKEAGKNGKLIYIVIEKEVYPVWENRWINDLGKTTLVEERKFGKLRLQKRLAQ